MRRSQHQRLGICDVTIGQSDGSGPLPFELNGLVTEGRRFFSTVYLFHPRQVAYEFQRDANRPQITRGDQSLTELSSLVVRSTRGAEEAVSLLVNTLRSVGCHVLDPPKRFLSLPTSKLLSTFDRHCRGVGTSSFIAFDSQGALDLIERMTFQGWLPLLAKPVYGRRGFGIQRLEDPGAARSYIQDHYGNGSSATAVLFQHLIQFTTEYRAVIVHGRCLGIVEKESADGVLAANVAQGGQVRAVAAPDVETFVGRHVAQDAILGVDVGRDPDGKLHIIEENYSPQWQAFQTATGINVAEVIVQYALEQLDS